MIVAMADIQVKNLPESLYERPRRYSRKYHRTISDIALEALEREVARYELHEKLPQPKINK